MSSFLCSIMGTDFFPDFTKPFFAASCSKAAILASKCAFSFSFRLNFFSLLFLVGTTLTPFAVDDGFLTEIDSFFVGGFSSSQSLPLSKSTPSSSSPFSGGCSAVVATTGTLCSCCCSGTVGEKTGTAAAG